MGGEGLLGLYKVGPLLKGHHAGARINNLDKRHEMDVFTPSKFVAGLSASLSKLLCFLFSA